MRGPRRPGGPGCVRSRWRDPGRRDPGRRPKRRSARRPDRWSWWVDVRQGRIVRRDRRVWHGDGRSRPGRPGAV